MISSIRVASVAVMLSLITALPSATALAQDDDDVNADRPGVGTSAATVARGALQLETGVDHARERRARATERRTSLGTLLRYGVLDGVELRLEGEPVVALRGPEDETNIGDIVLSVKLRILEGAEGVPRPTLSLLPALKLPTAPEPIGSERVDAALLGLASFGFGRLSADLNAGLAAIGQEGGSSYVVQGLTSATVSGDVTEKLSLLGEIFYRSPDERGGDHLVGVTVGAVYGLTRRLVIDTAVITSLVGRGPDYRIQAGLTARFGP
jgi:hypothetical protein